MVRIKKKEKKVIVIEQGQRKFPNIADKCSNIINKLSKIGYD
jgi:hypothetical protein